MSNNISDQIFKYRNLSDFEKLLFVKRELKISQEKVSSLLEENERLKNRINKQVKLTKEEKLELEKENPLIESLRIQVRISQKILNQLKDFGLYYKKGKLYKYEESK